MKIYLEDIERVNDMFRQIDLETGKPIESGDPAKPWKGFCCEQCWTAKRKKCVCRCGGACHGIGKMNKEGEQA